MAVDAREERDESSVSVGWKIEEVGRRWIKDELEAIGSLLLRDRMVD